MFGEKRNLTRFVPWLKSERATERENREMKFCYKFQPIDGDGGFLKVRSAGNVKVCKENVLVNMLIILNSESF